MFFSVTVEPWPEMNQASTIYVIKKLETTHKDNCLSRGNVDGRLVNVANDLERSPTTN